MVPSPPTRRTGVVSCDSSARLFRIVSSRSGMICAGLRPVFGRRFGAGLAVIRPGRPSFSKQGASSRLAVHGGAGAAGSRGPVPVPCLPGGLKGTGTARAAVSCRCRGRLRLGLAVRPCGRPFVRGCRSSPCRRRGAAGGRAGRAAPARRRRGRRSSRRRSRTGPPPARARRSRPAWRRRAAGSASGCCSASQGTVSASNPPRPDPDRADERPTGGTL